VKKVYLIILLTLISLALSATVVGGDTATQDITIIAESINEISLSKSSLDLTITPPPSDSGEEVVSDSSTTLSYSTNHSNQKITVEIGTNLSHGLNLFVEATSTGGVSSGEIILSDTEPTDLITDISNVSDSGETVTYTLIANRFVEPAAPETYTLTYTIISSN
jgi:hypothetical protein